MDFNEGMKNLLRLAISVTVIALCVNSVPFVSAAPTVRAGAACPKKGTVQVVGSKKFTCKAVGKKLQWDKGVTITKPVVVTPPTPTPTPTVDVVPAPTASPAPAKPIDDVQNVIDGIRTTALNSPDRSTSNFKFVFQAPTSLEIELKTKRSLLNAIPLFAKLGFPITDGLILVSKDDLWLKEELMRNGCNVDFTFPQSTGFYVGNTCQLGNGAITSKHWDVMKFEEGLDGLYFNHTLPHEYFHQIQFGMYRSKNPSFPKWLTEGSAQFFTNQAWVSWNPEKSYVDWYTHWWTVSNPQFGPNVCKSVSIQMMSDPSTPGPEGVCAYSKGQLVVEYFVYKYGLDKFRALFSLNSSRDWRNFNQVFKAVTNDDLNDFYADAEKFIESRGW